MSHLPYDDEEQARRPFMNPPKPLKEVSKPVSPKPEAAVEVETSPFPGHLGARGL